MPCVSPDTVIVQVRRGASTVTVTLHHCDDDGFMRIEAQFSPRNIGASVSVQGQIKVFGEMGFKDVTAKVQFCDDGTVLGYGDTSNGVRFPQKRFDMSRDHIARLKFA